MISISLMSLSALIILLLGMLHLLFTFSGHKLRPREASVQRLMQEVSPRITSQTNMWKAWIGFNASHSMGAILFGLVFGYLAMAHPALLFDSTYLLSVGLAMLCGLLYLAKRYWFRVPFMSIAAALTLYVASLFFREI